MTNGYPSRANFRTWDQGNLGWTILFQDLVHSKLYDRIRRNFCSMGFSGRLRRLAKLLSSA